MIHKNFNTFLIKDHAHITDIAYKPFYKEKLTYLGQSLNIAIRLQHSRFTQLDIPRYSYIFLFISLKISIMLHLPNHLDLSGMHVNGIQWLYSYSHALPEVLHNSCNMGTRDLPDMHALSPQAAPSGFGHTCQVNHSCPCYNYKLNYVWLHKRKFDSSKSSGISRTLCLLGHLVSTTLTNFIQSSLSLML